MEQTEKGFSQTQQNTDRIKHRQKQPFSELRRNIELFKRKNTDKKTVLFRTKKNKEKMLGLRFAISLKKKAEKHSASTCVSTRKNDIHNSFEKYMIEELRSLIAGEVINQCHGCQIDHPSQKQHDLCLFKTRQEHTEMFIEKIMMELNPYNIMEKWYPELRRMNLNGSDYVEAYKLWQDIKHNVLTEFTESWLQSWCDKVKQSWEVEFEV